MDNELEQRLEAFIRGLLTGGSAIVVEKTVLQTEAGIPASRWRISLEPPAADAV